MCAGSLQLSPRSLPFMVFLLLGWKVESKILCNLEASWQGGRLQT